jgi:hypothetical protein
VVSFCPGKALPIRRKRTNKKGEAKGMVFVTQTSPASVALRCVVFARSKSTQSNAASAEDHQDLQVGLLGEVTLLPEEGDRITCTSLVRHDSHGSTGYLLWLGTSNGTLLVINAAPAAYPSGCHSRIALVCQLHQKSPPLNPKQFSVDQGHEAIVAICAATAGAPSLRNPWFVAGEGLPVSNNGSVYTRSVDVLHQSGWLVSFDEEQIETLISSTAPRAAPPTSGVAIAPTVTERLSLSSEWRHAQEAHHTAHRGASSVTTSDSIPVACASGSIRDAMKRCVGHLLDPSHHGADSDSDLGTTAAACALLPAPGTSALDVLATSVSVKHQRVIVVSGFGDYGPALTFYSVNIRPEAALSAKSAALEVAGRITGAALRAVKGFWGRRSEAEEAAPPPTSVRQPQHSHTPITAASAIDATTVKAHSIVVSPSSHYAAVVASNSDRIMILDLVMGTVCRVFKGCRQCDVQWVECPSTDQRGGRRRADSTSAHFLLAIYHKIRGIVEFYSMRDAQRVAACKVESGLQLLRVEGVEPLSELLFISADQSRCFSARLELTVRHIDDNYEAQSDGALLDNAASLDVVLGKQLDDLITAAASPKPPVDGHGSMLTIVRSACEQEERKWDHRLKQMASSQRNVEKLKDDIQRALFASNTVILNHTAVDAAPVNDVSDCVRALRLLWVKFLGQPLAHDELAATQHGVSKPKTRAQQFHMMTLQAQALDLCCALAEPVVEHQLSQQAIAAVDEATPTTSSYWGTSLLSAMTFTRSDDSGASRHPTTPTEVLGKLVRRAARVGDAAIHSVANGTHWWAKVQTQLTQWCENVAASRSHSGGVPGHDVDCDDCGAPSARALLRCFAVTGPVLAFQSSHHEALVRDVLSHLARVSSTSEDKDVVGVVSDLLAFADACFGHLRSASLSAVLERQAPILEKLGVSGPGASLLLVTALLRRRGGGEAKRCSLFQDICFGSQAFGSSTTSAGTAFTQLAAGLRMCHLSSLVTGAAMLPVPLLATRNSADANVGTALESLTERALMLVMAAASQPPITPTTSASQQHAIQSSVHWAMRLVALGALLPLQLRIKTLDNVCVWSRLGSLCNEGDAKYSNNSRGSASSCSLYPFPPQYIPLALRSNEEDEGDDNAPIVDMGALRTAYDDLNVTVEVLEHRLQLQRALLWSTAVAAPHATGNAAICVGDASPHPTRSVGWSSAVFHRICQPIIEHHTIPSSTTQVIHELACALHLVAAVLVPLRPVVSQDTQAWKNQLPPDRHNFGAPSFADALSSSGNEWMSLVALSVSVCAALRDKMYAAFQKSLLAIGDAEALVNRVVESAVNDLYGGGPSLNGSSGKHPIASSRTLFPMTMPEEVTALQNLARFLAFHQYSADAVFMTLNDVTSLVGFLQWCLAQSTNSLRHGELITCVPWTEMFAVTSFQLLRADTVYPSLDATHHALLAEQRSRYRLAFVCSASVLAVKVMGQKSNTTSNRLPSQTRPASSREQLQHVASDVRSFALSLADVLQQDALLATGAADCAVVAYVLRNKNLGEVGVNSFLRDIVTQTSLRYPCAATMLLHLRRYVYTCIKWYASLEKGLTPSDKEGRTRHSNGSVKLRSSMSAEFQLWLRNKPASASEDTGQLPSHRIDDDDVFIGQCFYQQGDTDVAVDAHVRQSIGEGRLPQMLSGLRFVSDILSANAQEFRHADRGRVGFDVTLGGLDRVTATLEQVLLEGMSFAQK